MARIANFVDYQASPDSDFDPIPSGEYPAVITASEMKQTKAGTGQYLELEHQICEGPYAGKRVWARLNLDNPHATAVKIANQHLAQIRHATGRMQVQDSAELHNIPMLIRVELEPAGPKRERDGNEIKEWKALGGGPVAPVQQQRAPAPAAQQAPWQRAG